MENENLYEWILEQLRKNNAEDCYNYLNNNPQLTRDLYDDTLEYIYANIKPREINTIQDLAKLLNHNWNGDELNNAYGIDVKALCKRNKWIVLFPYSDDNLEIRGYIDDEVGAWEGGKYKLVKKGDFYEDLDEENVYHKATRNDLVDAEEDAHIFIHWCDDEHKPYVWAIETDYPDVTYFEILDEDSEDDEIWAKCCVIDCSKLLD